MKIAVFGGSFNPIHKGHVKMVQYLCENFDFDKILVIPAGIPSHKESYSVSERDRYNMCKIAFASFSKVEVSNIETDSGEVCYTIDTLMKLKKKNPTGIFYEIIGEDSADTFHFWKGYKEILRESQVIVFKREKQEKNKIDSTNRGFIFLQTPYFPYSSTEIRRYLEKIEKRENLNKLKDMLPKEVLKYILEKKIYITTRGTK